MSFSIKDLGPKKLDIYLTKVYIGPFILTFFVSLFVLVMQFLWKYIDDLIGKGITNDVILELLFYQSASLAPLALPLAVLLSSIMTFGNMGENFELTAAKASGISLLRYMRSLIIFSFMVSVLAFYFSNNILPIANLKAQKLLFDVRRLKPALNIKPKIFNRSIEGITMRIDSKTEDEKGTMRGVIIYDHAANKGNDNVLLASKGELYQTKDDKTLILKLYDGNQYKEKETNIAFAEKFESYKTSFKTWEKRFDLTQFKKQTSSDDYFKNLRQMLNLRQLNKYIDTIHQRQNEKIDALNKFYSEGIYFYKYKPIPNKQASISFYDTMQRLVPNDKAFLYDMTLAKARNIKSFQNITEKEIEYKHSEFVSYDIERQRKFTLSIACLVLFFVGAPLGAIIRKGGLGWPMFFSVIFFIIFHVSGIIGEKMAESKSLTTIQGMWMATLLFVPLGLFLTIKAKNDSAIYNFESYQNFFKGIAKRFKKKESQ